MTKKTCGRWAWTPVPRRYFLDPCVQYDQEIPQSRDADQPTVTLERATEQSLDIGRTTNSIFLVKMIDCKTREGTEVCIYT